jgi:hypothetical protein
MEVYRPDSELLRRAYPFAEELTDPETLAFDYSKPGAGPEDWYRYPRTVIHRLMRLAYQEGMDYLVESLESFRESTAAQLSYAIQHAERQRAALRRTSKPSGPGYPHGEPRPLSWALSSLGTLSNSQGTPKITHLGIHPPTSPSVYCHRSVIRVREDVDSRSTKEGGFMRRTVLLLAAMAVALLVVSGVALAVVKDCPRDCVGTNNPDRLIGSVNPQEMEGLRGGDSISGYRGEDIVDGDAGPDALYGGLGDDKVFGNAGNDYTEGDFGHDHIRTGTGADKVAARDGFRDYIFCGQGNRDLVYRDSFDHTQGCERTTDEKPSP